MFRDCTAGASRVIVERFKENPHVLRLRKLNISDWITRHGRKGLLDTNLKERFIAKIAFSAAVLLYEFAAL